MEILSPTVADQNRGRGIKKKSRKKLPVEPNKVGRGIHQINHTDY